jgi:3-phosphoinositide dependent protein kinase-1
MSQNVLNSYNSDSAFADGPSPVSSLNSTVGGGSVYPESYINGEGTSRNGRKGLTKSQASLTEEAAPKRHRFSKRQSKNGLAAVF